MPCVIRKGQQAKLQRLESKSSETSFCSKNKQTNKGSWGVVAVENTQNSAGLTCHEL